MSLDMKRKQIRLKAWDYSSSGWYFVTICTKDRFNYLGKVIAAEVILSKAGKISERFWREIPNHFQNCELAEFVIMPNHLHGILIINEVDKAYKTNKFAKPNSKSLSMIINQYKGSVKRECNKQGLKFEWQSRFYEHIIRNEKSYDKIKRYVYDNLLKWDLDEYYN